MRRRRRLLDRMKVFTVVVQRFGQGRRRNEVLLLDVLNEQLHRRSRGAMAATRVVPRKGQARRFDSVRGAWARTRSPGKRTFRVKHSCLLSKKEAYEREARLAIAQLPREPWP